MQKITYIYQAGRTARINDLENSAKEFFYGYFHMKKAYPDTSHLEFDNRSNISMTKLLNNFIRKLSGLPFFSDLIINSNNKKVLKNSNKKKSSFLEIKLGSRSEKSLLKLEKGFFY